MKFEIPDYFLCTLTLIFITLKLCHVINWSWWFVIMPMYGIPLITLIVAFIALTITLGSFAISKLINN